MLKLKRLVSALTLCFLSLPVLAQTEAGPASQPAAPAAPAAAAAPAPGDAEAAPQTILVSGSRPGPGLWKVSKGDHVMWVFGTYSPLPIKMEWRSREVEKVIAQSQEYLKPPGSGVSVGWGAVTALPFLIGVKKNPDGAELKDVLPPEVYARWRTLKQVYFGDDNGIERERPAFVAGQLSDRALKQAGLTNAGEVTRTIEKIVDRHQLKITDPSVHVQVKNPGQAVRDFKKSPMDDVPCLAKTIERLESDLLMMRARANAWAIGEYEDIRKLNYGDRAACMQAVTNSSLSKTQPELLTLNERALASWVAAAEKALATNASTFSVLQIKEILDPKGVLATLQAKGYTVEPPK
jgi:hypothetical protein